jgi:hypothetical protein
VFPEIGLSCSTDCGVLIVSRTRLDEFYGGVLVVSRTKLDELYCYIVLIVSRVNWISAMVLSWFFQGHNWMNYVLFIGCFKYTTRLIRRLCFTVVSRTQLD